MELLIEWRREGVGAGIPFRFCVEDFAIDRPPHPSRSPIQPEEMKGIGERSIREHEILSAKCMGAGTLSVMERSTDSVRLMTEEFHNIDLFVHLRGIQGAALTATRRYPFDSVPSRNVRYSQPAERAGIPAESGGVTSKTGVVAKSSRSLLPWIR